MGRWKCASEKRDWAFPSPRPWCCLRLWCAPTEQPPGQRWAGARTSHGELGAARDASFCTQRDQPAQSMLCAQTGPLARISSSPSARATVPMSGLCPRGRKRCRCTATASNGNGGDRGQSARGILWQRSPAWTPGAGVAASGCRAFVAPAPLLLRLAARLLTVAGRKVVSSGRFGVWKLLSISSTLYICLAYNVTKPACAPCARARETHECEQLERKLRPRGRPPGRRPPAATSPSAPPPSRASCSPSIQRAQHAPAAEF